MHARAEGDRAQDMTSVSDQLVFSLGGVLLGCSGGGLAGDL